MWREEGIDDSGVGSDADAFTAVYFVTPRRGGHHFSFFRQRLGGEPDDAGAAAARADRGGARAAPLGDLDGDLRERARHLLRGDRRPRAPPACRSRSTPTTAPRSGRCELARATIAAAIAAADICLPGFDDLAAITGLDAARGDDRALPRARRAHRRPQARRARRLGRRRAPAHPRSRRIRAGRSTRPVPAMRSAARSSPAWSPATISRAPAATPPPPRRSRPKATARSRRFLAERVRAASRVIAARRGRLDRPRADAPAQGAARALERAGAIRQDERVAVAVAFERLDRRALVDDARVVEDERGPRLEHREAQAFGAVGCEDARLAALDAVAADQRDRHQVDAVAMRAFGRRPADAVGGVDPELVRLDEPRLRAAQRRRRARRTRAACGATPAPRARSPRSARTSARGRRAARCIRPAASARAAARGGPRRRRRRSWRGGGAGSGRRRAGARRAAARPTTAAARRARRSSRRRSGRRRRARARHGRVRASAPASSAGATVGAPSASAFIAPWRARASAAPLRERGELGLGDLAPHRRQAAVGAREQALGRHVAQRRRDRRGDLLGRLDRVGGDVDHADHHVLALEQPHQLGRHVRVVALERDLVDAALRERGKHLLVLAPLARRASPSSRRWP